MTSAQTTPPCPLEPAGPPSARPQCPQPQSPQPPRVRGAHLGTPLEQAHHDRAVLARQTAPETHGGPHVEDHALIHPAGADAPVRLLGVDGSRIATRDGALAWSDPVAQLPEDAVMLGIRDGARLAARPVCEEDPAAEGLDLTDARRLALGLGTEDAGLVLTAVALIAWATATRFCPGCGSALDVTSSGWVRRCPADGSLQFPRVDPAVIMAVRDRDDHLLLAQNRRGRLTSVLAGFVEPGETLEAAVVREAWEETGVVVEEVEYIGSQTWPFPRSLMVGYRAWTSASRLRPRLLDGELATARWWEREELRRALAAGEVQLPGRSSLGHALIADWLGAPLE
ncbi:NAD(+) diphosphatase [Brachybacterium sp. EF45031]|uniref:NAD(+) diphosphatase n=1 Tax=Brachybacterium sillae TaxID=2810536 RepID=UPI00217CE8E7|nr:NAD(+) diphosphatase [Brachybacterium sillae]MCS6712454.1 NAD(+) diphosphatase [Brachybacterium sillae]